uniref:Uncharacterized protein n=1 Tax=Mesocestoides corti TaxID=53468 RepID=A0A5K3G1P1_MESCO
MLSCCEYSPPRSLIAHLTLLRIGSTLGCLVSSILRNGAQRFHVHLESKHPERPNHVRAGQSAQTPQSFEAGKALLLTNCCSDYAVLSVLSLLLLLQPKRLLLSTTRCDRAEARPISPQHSTATSPTRTTTTAAATTHATITKCFHQPPPLLLPILPLRLLLLPPQPPSPPPLLLLQPLTPKPQLPLLFLQNYHA